MRLGRARAVALVECADTIREVLATRSLYTWAATQPGAEPMAGRATAWAAVLPPAIEVVVRRSRHGGAFAALTGELFRAPRAAHELAVSLRLSRLGVPTPKIMAYALYPAFAGFWAERRPLGDAAGNEIGRAQRKFRRGPALRQLGEFAPIGGLEALFRPLSLA